MSHESLKDVRLRIHAHGIFTDGRAGAPTQEKKKTLDFKKVELTKEYQNCLGTESSAQSSLPEPKTPESARQRPLHQHAYVPKVCQLSIFTRHTVGQFFSLVCQPAKSRVDSYTSTNSRLWYMGVLHICICIIRKNCIIHHFYKLCHLKENFGIFLFFLFCCSVRN